MPEETKEMKGKGREETPEPMDVEDEEEEEETPEVCDILQLAKARYYLANTGHSGEQLGIVMKLVKKNKMAPYYKNICSALSWKEDASLTAELEKDNKEELEKLDAAIVDAKENHGDTEVRQAQLAKSKYFKRIGDLDTAIEDFENTMKNTVGTGQRIDICFEVIEILLSRNEFKKVLEYIETCKGFVEKGGDWERRNLLKVYEGAYLMLVRKFKEAASLLLESIATFTCYRLMSYNDFIFYTCVTAMVSLDRTTLKKKVLKSPEVLQVLEELPVVKRLLTSLHNCQYKDFFAALVDISDKLANDHWFAPHTSYFVREMRVVAYTQFLRSYRSVTLKSMGDVFGVSIEFIDKELSRFISANRINCKIDMVQGIVETNRPDTKNTQYSEIIREGDLLLHRLQKLSKVIAF